ncbi:hypothetical protein [Sediminitomix flava]|uniref:Glycosyl hydrolase family 49 n=1 Tax=Sediminitomix flava TaxID=379075 RepID=A0A315ZSR5_SEDFL|nr:hypothetical protein [Sediminitomix flava]PWJ37890.1 glycosyl hydrolase family 49 [Sediminitomix flava]
MRIILHYTLLLFTFIAPSFALAQLETVSWPESQDVLSDRYRVRMRLVNSTGDSQWKDVETLMSIPRNYDVEKHGFPAEDFKMEGNELIHKIAGGDACTDFLEDRNLSFIPFAFEGKIEVEVTKLYGESAERVEITPSAFEINPHYFTGKTVRFFMEKPEYISVNFVANDNKDNDRFNGFNIKYGLMLFGDQLEKNAAYSIPSPTGSGVVVWDNDLDLDVILNADIIYFPPGDHKMKDHKENNNEWIKDASLEKSLPLYHGQLRLRKEGQKVYIAPGAYVRGAFNANGNKNCWLYGRGIISGRDYLMHEIIHYDGEQSNGVWIQTTQTKAAFCHFSDGAQYHGVIFKEAFHHTCPSGKNTTIRDIKIIGWCSNNDGIRPSRDSNVDHIFIKTSDDYDYARDDHSVTNSVFWPGVNGAIGMLGWGNLGSGYAKYKNNYLINSEWSSENKKNTGFIGSVADDGIKLENNIIENLNIESPTAYLVNATLENKNNYKEGYLRNFLFKNIKTSHPFMLPNGTFVKQDMKGLKNNWIEGWVFTNLVVGGELVTWENYKDYFDLNLVGDNGTNVDEKNWVRNITFNSQGDIHEITVTSNQGGTFAPQGKDRLIDCPSGTDQTFFFTPNEGYKIKEVLLDGVSQGHIQSLHLANVTANHEIEVIFEAGENVFDNSPFSAPDCTNLQGIGQLGASHADCDYVFLEWGADPCATSYIVKKRLKDTGDFQEIGTTESAFFRDEDIEENTTYEYVVVSQNDSEEKESSIMQLIMEECGTQACTFQDIDQLDLKIKNCGEVQLSWSSQRCVENYIVERKEEGEAEFSILETITETSYTDTNVVEGVTYTYQIKPVFGELVGSSAQPTIVIPACISGSYFQLINKVSGHVLRPFSQEQSAIAQIEISAADVWSVWKMEPQGAGFVSFKNMNTGKYLSMLSDVEGENITTSLSAGNNEKWEIIYSYDGYFRLYNPSIQRYIRAKSTEEMLNQPNGEIWVEVSSKYEEDDLMQWTVASVSYADYITSSDDQLRENKVSPNPIQDYIDLIYDLPSFDRYIYSASGTLVKRFGVNQKLDVRNLSSGLYILVCGNERYKFVKN